MDKEKKEEIRISPEELEKNEYGTGNLSNDKVGVDIKPTTDGNNVNISLCSLSISCSCIIC